MFKNKNIKMNEIIKLLLSCMLGFSLAILLKKNCVDSNCLIIKSPNEINDKIFGNGEKCYQYNPQKIECKK